MSILVRDVRRLDSRGNPMFKVQWRQCPVEEANWEVESDMCSSYSQFFINSGTSCLVVRGQTRVLVMDVVIT